MNGAVTKCLASYVTLVQCESAQIEAMPNGVSIKNFEQVKKQTSLTNTVTDIAFTRNSQVF